jgi:hypothetical protein
MKDIWSEQCMFLLTWKLMIDHPKSLTIKTSLLMKIVFMPEIGRNITLMHRRRHLQMHQNHGDSQVQCLVLLMRTMPVIVWPWCFILVSLFKCKARPSFGTRSIKILWSHPHSVLNSSQWRQPLNKSKPYVKSFGWWELLWMVRQMFLVTTKQFSKILYFWSQQLKRNIIWLHIIQRYKMFQTPLSQIQTLSGTNCVNPIFHMLQHFSNPL